MQKLSKEQADWLIESMKKQRTDTYWNALIGPNEFQFMENIINQCTEKEFPAYRFQDKDACSSFIDLSLFCPGGSSSKPLIGIRLFEGYLNLYAEEFKDFTLGCQKIVEWIEEQE